MGAADTIDALIKDVREAARRPRPTPPRAKPVSPSSRTGKPWVVLGAAFAIGFVAAKLVDWRGHAHPRL